MTKQIGVLFCVLFLISACTFVPHEVNVTAKAPKTESGIGAGVIIELQVIDDRDSMVVGQRGAGMFGADITAGNVMNVLEGELSAAFRAKGFIIATLDSEADAEVEVRLRAFKFFVETGFFTGAENASAVVAIEAEKRSKDFDRSYRSSSEDRILFVPGEGAIDDKLNAALSDVLKQIMADRELLEFLAN